MCGIAGIVRFDRPAAASREPVLRMQRALAHRGPDGAGVMEGSSCVLAHTRLAMLDPEDGAQPMRSADGRLTLVYNGELYDDPELRAELGGPWRTRSDAETVLAAWQRWGVGAIDRLDGMFAFFVWDERQRAGFAVRDPLGVKPLLFRRDHGFAFASEAKALLTLDPGPVHADLDAVLELLVAPAFSGVERSMFQGIEPLPPGHWLRVDEHGVELRPHWRWTPRPDPAVGPEELREALLHAIDRCTVADAPLGVFSSGGLDSTLVAARARRRLSPLPALTITFDGQERWEGRSAIVISDDTPFAHLAATELDLHERLVPFDRTRIDHWLDAVAVTDDALPAWEQELSQHALAQAAAAQGLKGILVGDAADETHYGYHFLLDAVATQGPRRIIERLGAVPVRAELDPDPIARLDRRLRERAEAAGASFDDPAQRVAATTQLVVSRWLPRLLHNGDLHCMAFGVEPRVPFAGRRVLELAQAIAPARALAGGVEKSVLREAARGLVPDAIRRRRKSALPKDQALGQAYLARLQRVRAEPHPLVRTLVDLLRLDTELRTHGLDERRRAAVFRVLCLQRWAEAYEVAAP
ncbi:MAG: asparagine synthase (glutamine-hydrolyzing) [Myxococcales bacterium]|nr:asparagine synthase (glutamine-hydrolyzing) [Myxococcales bacterium]MCB9714818.1 asparagine synthase (glutamine-hydrolyzing) [Myxococcales bacterium]